MWLFIIADTMTFAACLVAYGFLRNGTARLAQAFPQHHQRRPDDLHSPDQQLDHVDRTAVSEGGGQSRGLPLDHDYGGGGHYFRPAACSRMAGVDSAKA